MTDEDPIGRLHALLTVLHEKEGVGVVDVVGVARAGLLMVALTHGEGAGIRDLREWLSSLPAPSSPLPETRLGHYLRLARPWEVRRYVLLIWQEVEASGLDGDAVFETMWRALDRVEAERLLQEATT